MATRDWRHEDRFGSRDRDEDRRYGIGRFEQNQFTQQRDERGRFESDDDRDRDDDNRGWFDRVRDTASRWFHRDDDDDERDERERHTADEGRYEQRHRYSGDRDDERRPNERERFSRSWQDDDNRGRMRNEHDDNRARQFASNRGDDDRSGQFNRLHDDRGTLGRRGDIGRSGRTRFDRYDERGRFSGFAGDEDRRYFGESNRGRPIGDEQHTYERQRQYGRDQRSWADRELGREGRNYGYGHDERGRDEREMRREQRGYGQESQQFRPEQRGYGQESQQFRPEQRGYGYERDRGWDRQASERGRSMRGGYGQERGYDRDDDGRFAPGRQEHVEHDDNLRRGTSRLSDRSRRR